MRAYIAPLSVIKVKVMHFPFPWYIVTSNAWLDFEDDMPNEDANCVFYALQGITLKKNEEGRCIVARIMHGGMIHRQGKRSCILFHVFAHALKLLSRYFACG